MAPHSIGLDWVGDLEAARVNMEEKARQAAAKWASFQVHPQYREDLRRRLEALRKFEAGNVALKAERATLEVETNRDFTERSTVQEKELTLFNQHPRR